ncbi:MULTISPECIES: hypothetical protein [unclassified Sinorhizobium]|uniref:hypothetical protein n=1 Tax=unclassified Sinorhizobium TaxID=2613772 RepID=UPI00352346EC
MKMACPIGLSATYPSEGEKLVMPKAVFSTAVILLASVLLSGCLNTDPRYFNGCDYGDGVCNQGQRDQRVIRLRSHRDHHHRS